MLPSWKLIVEDLGRIGHAEIEARPLLLFVGSNNTGKTYLASLLWGLLSLSGGLTVPRGDAFRRCVTWLEERFVRREQEPQFGITPEVHADLTAIVNDMLREQAGVLASRTFNRTDFPIGKLELRDVIQQPDWQLRWETMEHKGRPHTRLALSGHRIGWGLPAHEAEQRAATIWFLARGRVLGNLGGIGAMVPGASPVGAHEGPVFLPASRTGFMLLYRSLAQQLIGDALTRTATPAPPVLDLTAPAIDFLKLLVGIRPVVGAYPDEAAFLERALGGRLTLRSGVGLNEVAYQHEGAATELPMELSSSLVTELAPVVLTLRHVSGYNVLLIEEPEAHLHPGLQRRLAQVIVRLVRKGLFVWITTHSENFCQQINNFMKLGVHPRRAEMQRRYGCEEMDYLDADDVAGYQFEVDDSGLRTVVTEMKKTESGLAMPTFNRELAALTDEAMDLEPTEVGE